MPELYPDDATLLSRSEDPATHVPFIETGRSPYYLEFRRMLDRLLRVAERAGDLRVYPSGDLSVGVSGGQCVIDDVTLNVDPIDEQVLATSTTTRLWIDGQGALQTGSDLPTDRTTFIPLAEVVTDDQSIQTLTDLRGRALMHAPSAAGLGISALPEKINQALDGITPNVTAQALSTLTAGPLSTADLYHGHSTFTYDTDDEAALLLTNQSADSEALVGLRMSLPSWLLADTSLELGPDSNFIQQVHEQTRYHLLGVVHRELLHAGALTTSLTDVPIGVVPATGSISNVILSVGQNIESSQANDAIAATVKANGASVTSTAPSLSADDGADFQSTDQNAGAAAVVKTDGSEQVARGDLLYLDLTRTVSGTVTQEFEDVAVLIVIRAAGPE